MKSKKGFKWVMNIAVVLLLAFLVSGCTALDFMKGSPDPAMSSDVSSEKTRKTTAVYYDFEDILLPMELVVVNEKTVVVSTPGFTSGIIALKGRVERRSLLNFFNANMQKDNWNVISQIKSPGTTIMVFQKTSRTAVITIRDEQIYTYVEVGVAPTVSAEPGLSESTLME